MLLLDDSDQRKTVLTFFQKPLHTITTRMQQSTTATTNAPLSRAAPVPRHPTTRVVNPVKPIMSRVTVPVSPSYRLHHATVSVSLIPCRRHATVSVKAQVSPLLRRRRAMPVSFTRPAPTTWSSWPSWRRSASTLSS